MRRALLCLAVSVGAMLGALGPSTAAPPPPDCKSPEHHQFDFWIGRWDVYNTKEGDHAGSSLIEGLYKGCVLRENWQSTDLVGGSLNVYDRDDHKWHQMWTDSAGSDDLFIGGLKDGKMVLVADITSVLHPGKKGLYRMTFTPNKDGTVRQYGEQSFDGGKTWSERYDLTYRRAK